MISKRHVLIAALAALMAPLGAAAQQADDAAGGPGGADAKAAQQGTSQGPMIVERVHSGWLVAPDFKVTRLDHRTSELAGAYGGWVADENVFFGAGLYVLTNGSRDREMAYGGFVFQWLGATDRTFGYSLKTLLGGGEATLTDSFTELVPVPRPIGSTVPIAFAPQTLQFRSRQQFFVVEPEANALVRLGRNVHLTVGAGYRFIGSDRWNPDTHRLSGATGTVGVQIGGGS